MTIEILRTTPRPLELVSEAAGCCYGRRDYSEKRVKTCFDKGHMSVFEHVSVTFLLTDVSRACTHQLVRHRVASYSQNSQRYTKLTYDDLKGGDWYVIPPHILANDMARSRYENRMRKSLEEYFRAIEDGEKPEDARFMLPEGTKTLIVVTMNLREIYHFLDVRYSSKAQWEIRQVAKDLHEALEEHKQDKAQWKYLMGLWEMKRER